MICVLHLHLENNGMPKITQKYRTEEFLRGIIANYDFFLFPDFYAVHFELILINQKGLYSVE